ncbi:lysine N(6)-hydroxylase/L-ornithine N(5)-oxygenase family protein [Paenibacillus sp. L3-i20]|uniref:lysine N(6)-hydroxylase/L-ornithine N(5)-oxygenase family protein n=1 Tax=Paenibacillus sp. L3-i20 TaxID=2905833 RepID=UPI001EDCB2C8|nr:lysine N(6)-hydroxylase/L-ornithine N(5)-oxygenase family protein [Paenibacillus sp. L3-i20]GKU76658.1 lysine 6-monooxygenase [Paenibacillus sp. L3-i20]
MLQNNKQVSSGEIYDVIGIGIGPFNLGLAALLDGIDELKALFIESKTHFHWHEGMLIDGTTLQVPFMADLVTMIDPTSPYSFLNYLKEQGRLYSFYFFEKFHIPRKEYNHYCQWAASKLNSCQFGQTVVDITLAWQDGKSVYEVTVVENESGNRCAYLARDIVVGIGTTPHMPSSVQNIASDTIFHSSRYMERSGHCKKSSSITVVGSGQSAAEIFYDLLKSQREFGYELSWMTRSRGFFPMEYSKLGLEHFSPDYSTYFYGLPKASKDKILDSQHLLYKGISAVTIADIYDELYHLTACGAGKEISMLPLTKVQEIQVGKSRGSVDGIGMENDENHVRHTLSCLQWEQEKPFQHKSEVVILATGYKYNVPAFLKGIHHTIKWDEQGRYEVAENYRLQMVEDTLPSNRIYVQNGELHTHGIGAPDLGLGAYRNAVIINDLLGRTKYAIGSRNVFQRFGVQ